MLICVFSQHNHFPANWTTIEAAYAVYLSSYPLSAITAAINAASSPMPYNSADFVL
jgi:hypothetical protein